MLLIVHELHFCSMISGFTISVFLKLSGTWVVSFCLLNRIVLKV